MKIKSVIMPEEIGDLPQNGGNSLIDRRIICAVFLSFPILSAVDFEGRYVLISLLFVFSFAYYYKFKGLKTISRSFPMIIWLILTVYHWINGMVNKVPEVDIYDLLHGMKIYACIGVFAFLARKNFDDTVKSLVICFTIYLIISLLASGISEKGRLSGLTSATYLGQVAAMSGIYIAFYSLRYRKSVLWSVGMYCIPVIVILMTQSRNALAMLAICIMGHFIARSVKRGGNLIKTVFSISLLGLIAFWTFNIVINNTELGNRFVDTENVELSQYRNNLETNTIFDKIAGDRLVYYVKGWMFFEQSPITGIGMWNYEYASGGNYPLHTEYMVHLAEGGLIGAILWLTFIICLISGVLKSKYPLYIKVVVFFSILEILFCALYARVFYYEFFYPAIGIALGISLWGTNVQKNTSLRWNNKQVS